MKRKKHNKQPLGLPKEEDWIEVKKMCGYLEKFYDLTVEVSGSKYVTAHNFFKEMCDLFTIIRRLESQEDDDIKNMAKKMKEKLGKYWLEETELNPDMNKIIYIAAILDPQQKMKHMLTCLKFVYGDYCASQLVEDINDSLHDLFELYHAEVTPVVDHTPAPPPTSSMANPLDNRRFLGQGLCSQLHITEEDDDDDDATRYSELKL